EAIKQNGSEWWNWVNRGLYYAQLGKWSEASADRARSIELGADPLVYGNSQALVYLGGGKEAVYRRACADLLQYAQEAHDLGVRHRLLWPLVVAPGALADPGVLVSLTEETVSFHPDSPAALRRFGMALVRTGNYSKAVGQLTKADRLDPD